MSTRAIALCFVLVSGLAGCTHNAPAPPAAKAGAGTSSQVAATESTPPAKLAVEHLPNAVRVHDRVISGGVPADETAFQELEALGIRTIISVDGAKPDVELSARHGMRYVHLPHGYDGIPYERVEELAKAVRDLPGPIYIHCHHGKHRSPAAAAVACVGAGLIDGSLALAVLELAGTSPNYRGLYESASLAHRIEDDELDSLRAEFPETAHLPELAEAMVALEHTHDHVKALAANGWRQLTTRPDFDSAHEALLLREHFTELLRSQDAANRPARFRELLQEGERAAMELETSLNAWTAAGRPNETPAALASSLERVTNNCTTCHKEFRDVPLSEKAGR